MTAILGTNSRRLMPVTIFAAALAAGFLTAPTANALSEAQIKSQCADAGGTYRTVLMRDGHRYSECCYKDNQGNKYCDYYWDGGYWSTGGPYNNATPPPSAPVLPPGAVRPAPGGANPGAPDTGNPAPPPPPANSPG
jgi:hypothetical protein